jgi:hypothetical protein
LAGPELAQQFGGGLVGDAEASAQRVAGDGLLVLVLGGGPAREGEQGLVRLVLDRGRPSRRGQVIGSTVLTGDFDSGPGPAGGAALDHGDRDQERGRGHWESVATCLEGSLACCPADVVLVWRRHAYRWPFGCS